MNRNPQRSLRPYVCHEGGILSSIEVQILTFCETPVKDIVDVGETRLFADHDAVGPLVVRMAVRGGAQDEQLAITMGESEP